MKRIVVFCGSNFGADEIFREQAFLLGTTLARMNIGIVYGGAKVGLMGAVADGAIREGGEVIGVLPNFLKGKEIAQENLAELILVETMHERKAKMNELSDGIIALPGGFGTLEELFEVLTWAQLGLHSKPCGILNIKGFFDPMIEFIKRMTDKQFLREEHAKLFLISDNIDDLLHQMKNYVAPPVRKWIMEEEI